MTQPTFPALTIGDDVMTVSEQLRGRGGQTLSASDATLLREKVRAADAVIVDEAVEAYPGILALPLGYIPVAKCLEGSGDPYFFRLNDGAIVRIPHQAAVGSELDEEQVEVVSDSVEELPSSGSME
jgi:hypothetical protein